ncbi:MAG: AMP-binding protein, partial [Clostridia bacterium]|nr:AMP-binding protein [Clostridia bacterium]
MQGVEIAGLNGPAFQGKGSPTNPELALATRRSLIRQNLSIPCADTVGDFMRPETDNELRECLEAAQNLDIPYVSLHTACEDSEAIAERVDPLLQAIENEKVVLLLETRDALADSGRLRGILNRFADDHLAALWNMHETFQAAGEDPETTITNLGAYVRHVHLCDSVKAEGALRHELVGEGELPIEALMNALRSVNYDGFVSFVWDPAWIDGLDSMDIILTHFASVMSGFETRRSRRRSSHLYYNNTRTGTYVWKKNELISKTFSQVLDTMVEEYPDQLAIRCTTLDYTRTYAQFRDDVDEFARALISLGVRAGSKVTIWATNVPQWFLTFWAATKIGAVLVTMNTAYKIHEAEYLLRQSDTHTLVMIEGYRDSNYREIVNELCPELKDSEPGRPLHARRLPFLRNVITVGFRMPGALTWEESLEYAAKTPREEVSRMAAAVDVNDVCNMQYTSGTTGFPKGVMLTHYNIVNDGKCIGDGMDLSTADRMMIQVPMFHCFGMVLAMTATMTHGGTILPLPYFSPKSSLSCINNEHITAFHGVPTM